MIYSLMIGAMCFVLSLPAGVFTGASIRTHGGGLTDEA